jgi:hypothetical protein
MTGNHHRMTREARTVEAMITLYCRDHHGRDHHGRSQDRSDAVLCPECETLRVYARQRLTKCPYQEGKTTCARCPTHCYKPELRQRVRAVMRYAGPRMLYRHPLLTLQHMFDGLRKVPAGPERSGGPRPGETSRPVRLDR